MSWDGSTGTRLPAGMTPGSGGAPRRLRLRDGASRRRTAVNRLMVLIAMAAIGFGGYEIWSVWDNRRTIDEACAGLVQAGKAMRLPYGGGRIEANPERIDATLHRGICRIYSTEAGEAAGTDSGVRLFFEASVALEPEADQEEADHTYDSLIDENFHPYLDGPVGGGIPGIVTDSGVGVKLACHGKTAPKDGGVRNVVATAVSSTDGHAPLNTGRQMDQETRDQLAVIAVDTANRLGEQLGCAGRLPEPPSHVPSVRGELINAAAADGTCAWYDRWSRGRPAEALPDRAMETATDPDVWKEKCGLALSGGRAAALWKEHLTRPGAEDDDAPTDPADLWVSTQSWFGESARYVHIGNSVDPVRAEPGKAGRDPERAVWWASSLCEGQPAVHTLTLNYEYGKAAAYDRKSAARFAPLFRAYVEDVAKRRGCTDLAFPEATEFTAPRT